MSNIDLSLKTVSDIIKDKETLKLRFIRERYSYFFIFF